MDFSCKHCDMKRGGCHATCDIYKREKAAHEARKEDIRKKKAIKEGLDFQMFSGIARRKSRKIKKWNGKEGNGR